MHIHARKKFHVSLILTFIISFSLNAYGYINNNQTGKGYEEGSGGNSIVKKTSIEDYIVVGGGYYLKANSSIQELLHMVELKDIEGLNFDESRKVVDTALENMIKALETYESLIAIAESTPYKSEVIEILNEFDYRDYRIMNGLNKSVFNHVEDFLKGGNITGVFIYTHSGFQEIVALLQSIKGSLDQNLMPDISICRQLNEKFSSLSLFGSYVARVFSEI